MAAMRAVHLLACWRRIAARLSGERGTVIVIVAGGMASLIGMAALTLDGGRFLEVRRQVQNAVDAAVHAGAAELPDLAAAQAVAEEYWDLNRPDVVGALVFDVAFPGGDDSRMEITASVDVDLVFGRALGLGPATVHAHAAAELTEEALPYAVMSLNSSDCASLAIDGASSLHVIDGGTYTRSQCPTGALRVWGSGGLSGTRHDAVGGAEVGGSATITPWARSGARMRPDALADLALPPIPADCYPGSTQFTSGVHVLSPDYRYCDEIEIMGSAHVTFPGGVYVLQEGIEVSGGGYMTSNGQGVLLFNTCESRIPCDGDTPDEMRFGGTVASDLVGHPDYANLVIWVDRTAGSLPSPSTIRLEGDAASGLRGTIYSPTGRVRIVGNASNDLTLSSSIIADTVEVSGNGVVQIHYDSGSAPRGRVLRLVD